MARMRKLLHELYEKLWDRFGPQGWWPGETPFEVALGAILTQNTNWQNVARVIDNLKLEGALDAVILRKMPDAELARRLRPAGYYNIKAARVKNFLAFFAQRHHDSMASMAAEDLGALRAELLAVKGIGPETADSILLYALHKPSFVVDAYTFRILSRHGLVENPLSYDELRQVFMEHLPADVELFQEYHALLVRVGKEFCRPRPKCSDCPLFGWPDGSGPAIVE
ncbi:MAG: endonuclease III domain-containing protein [Deltaproteobacteria bacterium]|nr:endonuclease III domain-containing protein [Deltaproteobacteria bacterium]